MGRRTITTIVIETHQLLVVRQSQASTFHAEGQEDANAGQANSTDMVEAGNREPQRSQGKNGLAGSTPDRWAHILLNSLLRLVARKP